MGVGREVWVKIRASEADLDRSAHRTGARAHPRAGSDRVEPEPDRPLGQYPQGERRGAGGGRASGRHRAGTRHFDRAGGTAMMIKFLARGTGSAATATDYLTREQLPAHEHDQDQDPAKNPEEVKVLRAIRTRWPLWPIRFSSSTSTRRASSRGYRRTTRAMRRLAVWWTSSRKPPGLGWNRTATPGQRSSTAKRAGVFTCMSWRRAAILRPARA